jgi:phosphatidylserine decarboxylase
MTPRQKENIQRFLDWCFVTCQALLPTHFLSWLMFHLARIKNEKFKNFFIGAFVKAYNVDMHDAEFERTANYPDFNTFFTRALKQNARPLDPDPRALLSPVDGRVSEIGDIRDGTLIQAKGRDYTVAELLGGAKSAALFRQGKFCTLYLAPFNYHRIHMPANGRLREWGYQPGRLFSVSELSARKIPKLFTRNERVCAVFESDFGPMAMVLVGALFVGGIETTWTGAVTPPHGQKAGVYTPMSPTVLLRGREMGRFNMGSTVILLTAPRMVNWRPQLLAGTNVRVGMSLGSLSKIV